MNLSEIKVQLFLNAGAALYFNASACYPVGCYSHILVSGDGVVILLYGFN